jgi:hypothetical protein
VALLTVTTVGLSPLADDSFAGHTSELLCSSIIQEISHQLVKGIWTIEVGEMACFVEDFLRRTGYFSSPADEVPAESGIPAVLHDRSAPFSRSFPTLRTTKSQGFCCGRIEPGGNRFPRLKSNSQTSVW